MSTRLMVIILEREAAIESLLEGLYNLGVRATVLRSQGMQRTLMEDVPLFAGLTAVAEGPSHHRTLLSVITEEELFQQAVDLVTRICEEFEGERTGVVFSLPVDFYQHL